MLSCRLSPLLFFVVVPCYRDGNDLHAVVVGFVIIRGVKYVLDVVTPVGQEFAVVGVYDGDAW